MIYKNWVVYLIKVMMTTVSWGQWLEPASQNVLFLNLVLLSSLNPGFAHFNGILTQVLLSARFLSLPTHCLSPPPSAPNPFLLRDFENLLILPGFSAASHIALKCILSCTTPDSSCMPLLHVSGHL